MKNKKKKCCPSCNSKNVAKISYGLPIFDTELQKERKSGKIILGGCIIWAGESPLYHCNKCGKEWGKAK